MSKPFFVTTPIYYANGLPHIGHAYTTIAADVVARAMRQAGKEVMFSTGTDEHGAKIAEKAVEAGQEPAVFVDDIASTFQGLWQRLHISHDVFIRTTEERHRLLVTNVLNRLYEEGKVYKGVYTALYCVGCEQYKTESELTNGRCSDHDRVPEETSEESWMLRMSDMQETLIAKIEADELFITPAQYRKEILSFLTSQKLEDLSISRKNVAWGIPLPFDPTHTTYVWVDAFLNYLTVLGWDGKSETPTVWPADVQFIGKDILRVHATIWQVLLLHLGLAVTQTLFTHGHILSGGKKMSKTLGNVIDVNEMIDMFGVDGTRYILLAAGNFGEDIDLTLERAREIYNADLANGLGNLVSRVMKLAERLESQEEYVSQKTLDMSDFLVSDALALVMQEVREANEYMSQKEPWKLAKEDIGEFTKVMQELLQRLADIAQGLTPFLPETTEKIKQALVTGKTEPLFQRLS